MIYDYRPSGVCAQLIRVDVDESGTINDVSILGGCSGNSQGVIALVKGRTAQEVIPLLEGILCGHKRSSCPNELTKALQAALDHQAD